MKPLAAAGQVSDAVPSSPSSVSLFQLVGGSLNVGSKITKKNREEKDFRSAHKTIHNNCQKRKYKSITKAEK